MDVTNDFVVLGISSIVSASVAFGVLKTRIQHTVTYEKHREICAKEREETSVALNKLFEAQKDMHGLIKEIHGYLKAKNGDTL